MAYKLGNRVKVSVSGTPGTGSITLGSALTGFVSFDTAGIADTDTMPYVIEDGAAWETGVGTYSSTGPTLARTTITSSSNSNSAINASANAIVMLSPLAADLQSGTAAGNLVKLDGSAKIPAVDGSQLTNLNASNISSGTINSARIPSISLTSGVTGTLPAANGGTGITSLGTNVSTAIGNATNAASGVVQLDGTGKLPALDGSALTGLLTSVNNSNWSGTQLSVANGGTGTTTAQGAMNAFAGAVTSGSYLRGNGTNVVMSAIQAADVPTLNQNTTGTAANVTGTVAVANGGTGVTTSTGTGSVVLSTSPSLVTPVLGTPASGNLANCTFPTLNQNTTGNAAGLSATLAIGSGGTNATSFTSNRVTYFDGTRLVGSANLTFNGTTLTAVNDAVVNTARVGIGGGSVAGNTALGVIALNSNTTGYFNTGVGYGALTTNSVGNQNTAVGFSALNVTTSSGNCAFGASALTGDTTGAFNVAIGQQALASNTTGNTNMGIGHATLYYNLTGSYNTGIGDQCLFNSTASNLTAIGALSLYSNTTGTGNTAIGYQALYSNTTAIQNTAVGFQSLQANTTGANNTAVGNNGLGAVSTGTQNTAIGDGAGGNITTGSNNSCVGYIAGTEAGVRNITTASNEGAFGNNATVGLYVKVAWTAVSDARDKNILGNVPHGLDFVSKLEPVKYQFKKSREDDEGNGPIRYGFLAQDILPLEGDEPIVINNDDPEHLKYTDANMTPILVNAIKELLAQVEELKAKVN